MHQQFLDAVLQVTRELMQEAVVTGQSKIQAQGTIAAMIAHLSGNTELTPSQIQQVCALLDLYTCVVTRQAVQAALQEALK